MREERFYDNFGAKKQVRIERIKSREGVNVYQVQYRYIHERIDPKPWRRYKEIHDCEDLYDCKRLLVEELKFLRLAFPQKFKSIELINERVQMFDRAFMKNLRDETVNKKYS